MGGRHDIDQPWRAGLDGTQCAAYSPEAEWVAECVAGAEREVSHSRRPESSRQQVHGAVAARRYRDFVWGEALHDLTSLLERADDGGPRTRDELRRRGQRGVQAGENPPAARARVHEKDDPSLGAHASAVPGRNATLMAPLPRRCTSAAKAAE